MKGRHIIVLVLCAAVLFGGIAAYLSWQKKPNEIEVHGLVPALTQQELILNSDIIVSGTVSDIGEGKWSNPNFKIEGKRNIIQTDITVSVDELLSGTYENDTVVVRINKGYDKESNTKIISDGYPDFNIGEKVVLFLSRDDGNLATQEDYFVLTGMLQGKWTLDKNDLLSPPSAANEYNLKQKNMTALKKEIQKEQESNPNWKVQKAIQKEQIHKQNLELFGE